MTTAQEPGSRLADELALLLAAVADRAGPWLDRVSTSTHEDHEPPTGVCESCPICAFLALVRGEPNALASATLDRLADVIALLRAVLADRWDPGTPHMPGFRPDPPPRPTSTRVQRIKVRRKAPR